MSLFYVRVLSICYGGLEVGASFPIVYEVGVFVEGISTRLVSFYE